MIRVGTDLVSISRIKKARARFGERFLRRYLHADEYCPDSSDASLAGRWAAKEAIAKALGCGIGSELAFHDIFLNKDAKGAPFFTLTPEAGTRFPILESSLSISHDGGFAMAVVVIIMSSE